MKKVASKNEDWRKNIKEWKCICQMSLPFWGSKTDDGFIRCQECKRVWSFTGKLLEVFN